MHKGSGIMVCMSKKKPNDRHLAPRITLRLPSKESEILKQLAERNERTLTAEILRALRKHFTEEGLWPPSSTAD